jgi:hypothetical protein
MLSAPETATPREVRFAPSVKMNDGRSLTEEAALEASGECQLELVTQLVLRQCQIRRLEPACASGLINLQVLSRASGVVLRA